MLPLPGYYIEFSDCEKEGEITAFYLDVRVTELGIAPIIYDKALDDVRQWFARQQENLESDYYLLYKGDNR